MAACHEIRGWEPRVNFTYQSLFHIVVIWDLQRPAPSSESFIRSKELKTAHTDTLTLDLKDVIFVRYETVSVLMI